MSAMANTTPVVTTVTKTATKEKTPNGAKAASRVNILDFCEEHYEDILPVMDKIRRDNRKEVHTMLDFEENSRKSRRMREDSQNSSAKTLFAKYRNPLERPQIRDRLRNNDENVFGRLGHRRQSAFKRLSDTYPPSTTKSGPDMEYYRDDSYSRGHPHKRNSSPSRDPPRNKDRSHGIKESYGNTYPSYRTGDKHRYKSYGTGRSSSMKRGNNNESPLSRVSESGTSEEGHWKSKSKRRKSIDKEDLANRRPRGSCEKFSSLSTGRRWAMPTWYHMFNSTLIGTARVLFDELPPESIDGYKDLKAAFLAYFMQQKKHVKDPVEIHNIKQKDGETIEDFMERFKVKTRRMKGAPECMRISGFMHGANNSELTKRLNEHVPKTMEEMMTATTAFIRGETAAAFKKKEPAKGWAGSNKFTPLTRMTKEIFTAESGKFKPPPPMLRKQIEELVKAGKLSHFIKEIRQDRDQQKTRKKDAPVKDKAATIYMIQPWQIVTRHKVTQSFAHVKQITFPPLTAN
nr:hypothetical protein [Tanacetum cinerariifolium]